MRPPQAQTASLVQPTSSIINGDRAATMVEWSIELVKRGDSRSDEIGKTLSARQIYESDWWCGGNDTFRAICRGYFHVWKRMTPEEKLSAGMQLTNLGTVYRVTVTIVAFKFRFVIINPRKSKKWKQL